MLAWIRTTLCPCLHFIICVTRGSTVIIRDNSQICLFLLYYR